MIGDGSESGMSKRRLRNFLVHPGNPGFGSSATC